MVSSLLTRSCFSWAAGPKSRRWLDLRSIVSARQNLGIERATAEVQQKLLWVNGGNSFIAQSIINLAESDGWRVVSAKRGCDRKQTIMGTITLLEHREEDRFCAKRLQRLFKESIEDFKGNVLFFNPVGGSNETDLHKLNVISARCFAEAVDAFSQGFPEIRADLVHCSSIAAALLPETDYGRTKKEADELLLECGKFANIDAIYCFRIGYAIPPILAPTHMKDAHDFGVDQVIWHAPVHPIVVGESNIERSNIFPVYVDDIAKAVLEISNQKRDLPIRKVVDAVGDESCTQSKLYRFYADVYGRDFCPFTVRWDEFDLIAQAFPKGRIARYAAAFFNLPDVRAQDMDPALFKELAGGKLTSLEEIKVEALRGGIDSNIEPPSDPIFSYALYVFRRILRSKRLQEDVDVTCQATHTLFRLFGRGMLKFGSDWLGINKG